MNLQQIHYSYLHCYFCSLCLSLSLSLSLPLPLPPSLLIQIPSELITLNPGEINRVHLSGQAGSRGAEEEDSEEEEEGEGEEGRKDGKAKKAKLKKRTRGKGTLTKRLHSRQKARDDKTRVRVQSTLRWRLFAGTLIYVICEL